MAAGERDLQQTAFVQPVEKIADRVGTDALFVVFGTSLDLGTSAGAFNRGCVELNKIGTFGVGGDPLAMVAMKLASGGVRVGAMALSRRHGRHRLANIIRYVGAIVDGGVSVSNLLCGR